VSVEEVADQLYALSPEDFTAARTAAARADKPHAKQINALRRPTVGAWLVNSLARHEPELLDQLLALGPALAQAQQSGQAAVLRDLGEQRRQLIGAVTDKAFQAAGRAHSAAARAEVESTLEAALADPVSADAVRSGRLIRALSYAGFGAVDLNGAIAVGPSRTTPTTSTLPARPNYSKDIAAAETRAHDAAGALDDAARACEHAQAEQDSSDAAAQHAAAEVAAAEHALRGARDRHTATEAGLRRARRRTEQAVKAVDEAQDKAERARAALDKLRRG